MRAVWSHTCFRTAPRDSTDLISMKGEDRWRGWKWQRDQLPNPTVFYSPCLPPLLETLTLHWNGLIVSRPAGECSSSLIAGGEGFKMRGGEAPTKAFCSSRGVGLPALLSAVGSDFMCCMCWPKCNQPPPSPKTYSWCRSLRGEDCACGSSWTNEVCFGGIQTTAPGQKQPHSWGTRWQIVIVRKEMTEKSCWKQTSMFPPFLPFLVN